MSGSLDKTVRLWDLRGPTCRGLLTLPSNPIIAYDSTGVVFAVAVNHYSRILLYDQANFDKAPFLVITLEDPTLALISYPPRPIYMTSMAFSSNGRYLLVGCSGDAHYIMDAFEGHLLAKLEGHVGLERRSLSAPPSIEPVKGSSGEEVSWTPDSKYVVGGSLDGKVFVWDVQNLPIRSGDVDLKVPPLRLQPLVSLDGHPGPSRCVRFNPRVAMICTAGSELVRNFSRQCINTLCSMILLGLLAARHRCRRGRDRARVAEEKRSHVITISADHISAGSTSANPLQLRFERERRMLMNRIFVKCFARISWKCMS
jgi:COMPASS component SWD2